MSPKVELTRSSAAETAAPTKKAKHERSAKDAALIDQFSQLLDQIAAELSAATEVQSEKPVVKQAPKIEVKTNHPKVKAKLAEHEVRAAGAQATVDAEPAVSEKEVVKSEDKAAEIEAKHQESKDAQAGEPSQKACESKESAPVQVPQQQAQPEATATVAAGSASVVAEATEQVVEESELGVQTQQTAVASSDTDSVSEELGSFEKKVTSDTQEQGEQQLEGEVQTQDEAAVPVSADSSIEQTAPEVQKGGVELVQAKESAVGSAAPVDETVAAASPETSAPVEEAAIAQKPVMPQPANDQTTSRAERAADQARATSQYAQPAFGNPVVPATAEANRQTNAETLSVLSLTSLNSSSSRELTTRDIALMSVASNRSVEAAGSKGLDHKAGTTGQHQQQSLLSQHGESSFGRQSEVKADAPKTPVRLSRGQVMHNLEKVESALREAARSKDGSTISLRLDPPNLGQVKVDVTLRDGHLHARLSAESPAVVSMLREKGQDLQMILRKAGVDVEQVSVSVTSDSSSSQFSDSLGGQTQSNRESASQTQASAPQAAGTVAGTWEGQRTNAVIDHWVA